jgi:hypothetical protein
MPQEMHTYMETVDAPGTSEPSETVENLILDVLAA